MGTNYYITHPKLKEPVHIGKASGGWYFSINLTSDFIGKFFEKHPKEAITWENYKSNLKAVIDSLGFQIENEYEEVYTFDYFVSIIENRNWLGHIRSNIKNIKIGLGNQFYHMEGTSNCVKVDEYCPVMFIDRDFS